MLYHVYLKLSRTFFVVIDPVYPVSGCQHHVKVGCYREHSATILRVKMRGARMQSCCRQVVAHPQERGARASYKPVGLVH